MADQRRDESPAGDAGRPPEGPPGRGGAYDYSGPFTVDYRPRRNGEPDPGEVVWAWVAFEDDPRIGKDRPIVLVGRIRDGRFAALMLSSRDRGGQWGWLGLGTGSWDPDRRPSWVRLDRPLAVATSAVRREGASLPMAQYERIVTALVSTGARISVHGRRSLLSKVMGVVRRRLGR